MGDRNKVAARQATYGGRIDSLESILELLKNLKIRALRVRPLVSTVHRCVRRYAWGLITTTGCSLAGGGVTEGLLGEESTVEK
jgi:hypothetical protein